MWRLTCPQCGAAMGTVPKAGAHIERCRACQGVFPDSGQLDRFLAAEAAYYARDAHQDGRRGFVAQLFG